MFRSLFPSSFAPQLAAAWNLGTRGAIAEAQEAALAIQHQAVAAEDAEAEAVAALQIAWFCFQEGRVEPGLERAGAAKRIFAALGSRPGEAAAEAMTAWLLIEVGLSEEASREAMEALAALDAASDPDIVAFVTNVLGMVFWMAQQLEQALPVCEEAIALATRAQDVVATAWWRVNLAGVHAAIGYRALDDSRPAEAEAALAIAVAINQRAFEEARLIGDLWCQHLTLCNAAEYLCAAGLVEDAAASLARCDALAPVGSRRSRTHYLFTKTEVLLRAGRIAEARPICEEALQLATLTGDVEGKAQSFKHLAAIHEQLGDFREALACFKQFFAAHQLLTAEKTQLLARIASIRYETQKLRRQAEAAEAQVADLTQSAQSDPLTGLANRRVFDKLLAALPQQQRAYALAIVDLDHFKQINDRFSHLVGDEVLKRVGTVLADCCRPGDLAVRLGGEEFALVLPGDDHEAATAVCEAVRSSLAESDWQVHHPELKVTASIGLADSDEAAEPAAVLALADQRVYQAKKQGRNRLVTGAPAGDTAACWPRPVHTNLR